MVLYPNGFTKKIGSGWQNPWAIAVDNKGDVYVAEIDSTVKKMSSPIVDCTSLTSVTNVTVTNS